MTTPATYSDTPRLDVLTDEEQQQLDAAEVVIKRGLETFYEVGRALLHIRDHRLYRAEFRTFEAYCREKWRLPRSSAYELIYAAETAAVLSEHFDTLPNNLSQCSALTPLSPEEKIEAWRVAQATVKGGMTRAHLQGVASTLREVKTPEHVRELPLPPAPVADAGGVVGPQVMRFADPEWRALRELAEARRCSVYTVLKSLIHDARKGN